MKKRRIIILCVLLVTIVLVLIINNINIFKVTTKSPEEIYNIVSSKYNLDEVDVSVIKYHSVTGASWFVEKSTEKELENKNVCLSSVLNPRQLKVNKDFELDYFAQYVIVTKKKDKYMEIAKETVEILFMQSQINILPQSRCMFHSQKLIRKDISPQGKNFTVYHQYISYVLLQCKINNAQL